MAKPIFVVHLIHTISREKFNYIHNKIVEELKPDYHILMLSDLKDEGISFECFNDCKGLKDKDIEALINAIKNE